MEPLSRREFQMAMEELVLRARPDINLGDLKHHVRRMEEELFGRRGRDDEPSTDEIEGYAGFVGGQEA